MHMKLRAANWVSLPTIATAAMELANVVAGVQQQIATTEEFLLAGTSFAPAQLDEAYQIVLEQEAWVYALLHRVRNWQLHVHHSRYKHAMLKAIIDEGAVALDKITHLTRLVELLPPRRRPPLTLKPPFCVGSQGVNSITLWNGVLNKCTTEVRTLAV